MAKGQRFYFDPAKNGLPATKEQSWQAANQFWKNTQGELDKSRKAAHPHRPTIHELERREAWAKGHGELDEASRLAEQRDVVERLGTADEPPSLSPDVERIVDTARLFGVEVPPDLDPDALEQLFGDGRLWQDRLQREKQIPQDRTIGHQFDVWYEGQQARVKTGEIAPDRADNYRCAIGQFVKWMGRSTPVEAITSEVWRDFCNKLVRDKISKGEWSESYASDIQRHCRRFVKDLFEGEVLDRLPLNLTNKTLAVTVPQKKKIRFTLPEVQTLLTTATGKLRCFLLLMLNCGYTQQDLSDLRPDEVDWKAGRIIRKRSKTKKKEDTPEVSYLLWDETFTLLKKYRSSDPNHVFLTNRHQPYLVKKLVDGKLKKSDNFMSLYRKLREKTGIDKPPKSIRKTSSQELENSDKYRDFATYFLGHGDKTVKAKHYTDPSGKLFDAAVKYLGTKYGL